MVHFNLMDIERKIQDIILNVCCDLDAAKKTFKSSILLPLEVGSFEQNIQVSVLFEYLGKRQVEDYTQIAYSVLILDPDKTRKYSQADSFVLRVLLDGNSVLYSEEGEPQVKIQAFSSDILDSEFDVQKLATTLQELGIEDVLRKNTFVPMWQSLVTSQQVDYLYASGFLTDEQYKKINLTKRLDNK